MVMVAGGRLLSVLVCAAAFATSCVSPPAKTTESHPANAPVEKQPEKPAAVPDAAPVTQPAREFVASEELYRIT
ncbi:MAG: hypothetical protein ABSG21_18220, partial [Spirochaetia bacterium]